MRIQTIGLIVSISCFAGSSFAAGEQLANLSSQQPKSVTEAEKTTSVSERTRSVTINARSRKTQKQFESSLRRHYPQSYLMIQKLADADRKAVYNNFKSGTPMKDLRIEVIELYASIEK